jgi:hypothetical protein
MTSSTPAFHREATLLKMMSEAAGIFFCLPL